VNEGTSQDVHLAALDQRVTGLEQGIKDVVTAVSILSNEIRQGGKTQWPVIWSAVGVGISVLSLIGAMAYFPIREAQADFRNDLHRLDGEMVPRVEHERIWRYQERLSDLNVVNATARAEELQRRIARVEDDLYRRSRTAVPVN
jgi:hypothetical protein